ncbi:MAG: TetR/AcrR family transcriptional regulator C-terminal domain-containing protein [Christensenellales bacterium]
MAKRNQDLRIKKTQRALATAMLTLLETSAFSKITVHDLCTEALVSRSTFYVHFQDKYALLHFCLEMLSDRLFSEYEDIPFDVRIKKILQTFQENKRILKNIIGTELDMELAQMIRKNFQKDMERELSMRNIQSDLFSRHVDIFAVYYAAGVTHTILYWLSKSQPDSIDDLAECFRLLLMPM